jgi:nucleoside-diphosphate-sugar epimerase
MRILIVGPGYVGSRLADEWNASGHEVFGLRRTRPPGATSAPKNLLFADITKQEELARLPADFDWVVNCVSSSGGGAAEYQATYLEGNRNLVSWLGARPPLKYVYTSSTGVYGQNDGSVVTETSPVEPEAETARALLAAENLLREAARRNGFPAVILRVAGIYGPGRGYWLRQFLSGEARIEGAGRRILNMIHRDDVTGAIRAALERGLPGETYNVVDDQPVTQRELFDWLATHTGRTAPHAVPDDPERNRKRGVTNKRVSNLKLRTELGYALQYPSFREGFTKELGSSA